MGCPMTKLILADLSEGRIIAGLVTSLVFNWDSVPIGLQTAIVCHASETGFGTADPGGESDEQIVRFIKTHHKAIRRGPSHRRWSPRHIWSGWIRKRRVIKSINRPISSLSR